MSILQGLTPTLVQLLEPHVNDEDLIESVLKTYLHIANAFWKAITSGLSYDETCFVRPPDKFVLPALNEKLHWKLALEAVIKDAQVAGWEVVVKYRMDKMHQYNTGAYVYVYCIRSKCICAYTSLYQIPTCASQPHARKFSDYIADKDLLDTLDYYNINTQTNYSLILRLLREIDLIQRFGYAVSSFRSKAADALQGKTIVTAFNKRYANAYTFNWKRQKDKPNSKILVYIVKPL
jgi:hypothetical protein